MPTAKALAERILRRGRRKADERRKSVNDWVAKKPIGEHHDFRRAFPACKRQVRVSVSQAKRSRIIGLF